MEGPVKILPNYTYADYLQWEGNWELIDGIPFAMSPLPSPKHQAIAGKIHSAFLIATREQDCECEVCQPIDLKIDEHTVVHPDLLIVCEPIEKQFLDFPPVLVVEILSPSTQIKDRNSKFILYQNFGIRYYLILDPKTNQVFYFELDEAGKYQEVDFIEAFELEKDCKIKADLSLIW